MEMIDLDGLIAVAFMLTVCWRFYVLFWTGNVFRPWNQRRPTPPNETYRKPLIVFFAFFTLASLYRLLTSPNDIRHDHRMYAICFGTFLGMTLWHIYKARTATKDTEGPAVIEEGDTFAILISNLFNTFGQKPTQKQIDDLRAMPAEQRSQWIKDFWDHHETRHYEKQAFDPDYIADFCVYFGSPMHPPYDAFMEYANSGIEGEPRSIEDHIRNRSEEFLTSVAHHILANPPQADLEDGIWAPDPLAYLEYALLTAISLKLPGVQAQVADRESRDLNFRIHMDEGKEFYNGFRESQKVEINWPSRQEILDDIAGLSPSSVYTLSRHFYEDRELSRLLVEKFGDVAEYREEIDYWKD